MMRRVMYLVVISLLLQDSIRATVINVPGNSSTIQGAIELAQPFDSVIVADGYYTGDGNRDISFLGKPIVVMSLNGPAVTTIDCEGTSVEPHRGFHFFNGESANSVLQGLTIKNGYAPAHPDYPNWPMGGAIRISGCSPTITACRFIDNSSANGGAGMAAVNGSNPMVQDCYFEGNDSQYGAGMYCYQGSAPTLSSCVFVGNTASFDGAGMNCAFDSSPTLSSCLFIDNAAMVGGALQCYGGSNAALNGCTLFHNSASSGSGISSNNSSVSAAATIIAFGTGGSAVSCVMGGDCNLSCSDVYGNSTVDWTGCIASQVDLYGNFSSDPLFCDPTTRDLGIASVSLCAPDNNSCGVLIGAVPVSSSCVRRVWRVNASGTGDAPTIQAAIDSAAYSDTVLVESGVYIGSGNRDISPRGKAVVVVSEMGPDQTVLDCQGSTPEPHRAFDITQGEGLATVISGFTITGGVAPMQDPYPAWPMGGGIRCLGTSPTISNCKFVNNSSENGGGGMASVNSSSPTISDCLFSTNIAVYGAGLYFYQSSSGQVKDCIFEGNAASSDGGAMSASFFCAPVISHCQFIKNSANISGGFHSYWQSDVTISNCTFVGNTANNGSSISASYSLVEVNNSILSYGRAGSVSNCVNAGFIDISCSDVFGNEGGDWVNCFASQGTASGNISVDPQFCDTAAGDFGLNTNSACAASNNECSTLMGALGIGCSYACGDVNADGIVSISDCLYLIQYIFAGGTPPMDPAGGDINCNGRVNIGDAVYLINYIFSGGAAPCASC